MLTKHPLIILIFLFVFFSKPLLKAQNTFSFSDGWGIGANIGLNYFYGDVSDDKGRIWNNTPLSGFYYTDKNVMISTHLSKDLSRFFGLRGHLAYGKISGSNEKTNMYFNGSIYSMEMDLTFQYIDFFFNRPESKKMKYYAFGGLGLFSYNSIRRDALTNDFQYARGFDDKGVAIKLSTEKVAKLGLGIAYQLNKKWLFNFESSLHYVSTDYLDSYKSTDSKLEGYGFMSFGFVYKFNFDFNKHNSNGLWEKSKGDNDRTHNSGLTNKKKKKLHNKWKK
ncbi:MAG: hypothetical protein WCO13_01145 [Bacteroidota bacterium]